MTCSGVRPSAFPPPGAEHVLRSGGAPVRRCRRRATAPARALPAIHGERRPLTSEQRNARGGVPNQDDAPVAPPRRLDLDDFVEVRAAIGREQVEHLIDEPSAPAIDRLELSSTA